MNPGIVGGSPRTGSLAHTKAPMGDRGLRYGTMRRGIPQWCMNKASNRMIGSGMPMSQSNIPRPKPMCYSQIGFLPIMHRDAEGSAQGRQERFVLSWNSITAGGDLTAQALCRSHPVQPS
jgi:hypothetical protein